MAVVFGKKTDIGQYEYKCGNGSWTPVNVSNSKPLGKKSDSINVIYLKPTDQLRFVAEGDKYWTRLESIRKASLNFLAWDMTNEAVCGEQSVNVSDIQKKEFFR